MALGAAAAITSGPSPCRRRGRCPVRAVQTRRSRPP